MSVAVETGFNVQVEVNVSAGVFNVLVEVGFID